MRNLDLVSISNEAKPEPDLVLEEYSVREPNLLIPGKKPVGSVKIDWEHPIAPTLRNVMLFDRPDLITNANVTLNGNVSIEPGGILHGPGNSGDWANAVSNLPYGSSQRYLAAIVTLGEFNTGTLSAIISQGEPAGTGSLFILFAEDNAISVGFYNHRIITPKGALSVGQKIHVLIQNTSSSSSSTEIYINGVKQALTTEAGSNITMNTINRLDFFDDYGGGGNFGKHDIEFFYGGAGNLSEEQIANLARDPYQFLIPA